MKHAFIDHHSLGDSAVHRLHPATKAAAAAAVLAVSLAAPFPRYAPLVPPALFLLLGALMSRVSLPHLLGKMKIPLGFTLLAVAFMPFFRPSPTRLVLAVGPFAIPYYAESAARALHIAAGAALAIAAMILLLATTPFQDLLRVLERIRVPNLLLRILAVFYRYLFILTDEAEKMELAVAARSAGAFHRGRQLRMAGNLAGVLFLRSLERGEQVYQSMCARGFAGRFPSLAAPRFHAADALAAALVLAAAALSLWRMLAP